MSIPAILPKTMRAWAIASLAPAVASDVPLSIEKYDTLRTGK